MIDREDLQLAGDHVTLTTDGNTTTLSFDNKHTGRRCGGCTLCCKLLPVPTIAKLAGERCKHQRGGKGCAIYAARPMACRVWTCRWLSDKETEGMPRPDRCHYVIDAQEDVVRAKPHDGSPASVHPVLQIWIDPAFPDAYRAPELRRYMLAMAEKHGLAALIRYDDVRCFSVWAPPLASDRQWHEVREGRLVPREQLEADIRADTARAEPA